MEITKDKIFISHSNKAIKIIEAFVEKILILGLEVSPNRIFCSSMEGHGVKSGQYIPDKLREEIRVSSIALLFISKDYKSSEICLNEVGAAWVTLEKEKVLPLLLPDIDFSELGFLNFSRLGLKIYERQGILKLIQDNKATLNPNFNLEKLNKQIDLFLKEFETINSLESTPIKPEKLEKEDDFDKCFNKNLYPFDEIIRKSIPSFNDGIHEIIDSKNQNKILAGLDKLNSKSKWYRHAGGDFYITQLKKLPSGNWLMNSRWEIKISKMWVSMSCELGYEFILIHSEAQEPFKISSDVGGESYFVGILNDGTIVSSNEYSNGYAIVDDETLNLAEYKVEPRYRDYVSRWIFFITYFHKAGYNHDETMAFCKKLDSGEIEVNEDNILYFLSKLRNHPLINQNR